LTRNWGVDPHQPVPQQQEPTWATYSCNRLGSFVCHRRPRSFASRR